MMLGDGHLGIGRGSESVCLESEVLFSLCKGTIRERTVEEMEKMGWQDQGDMNLLRISGKGRDERSAQTMKKLRINRPRAHGGKRPPELAHRHFGHPGGGICFGFKMSRGSFLEKVDFYKHQGHFLKEAFSGCAGMRPRATPQHNLEGGEKRSYERF